jgi:hypothetical protein
MLASSFLIGQITPSICNWQSCNFIAEMQEIKESSGRGWFDWASSCCQISELCSRAGRQTRPTTGCLRSPLSFHDWFATFVRELPATVRCVQWENDPDRACCPINIYPASFNTIWRCENERAAQFPPRGDSVTRFFPWQMTRDVLCV